MRFISFTIKNFKGIQDCTIKLDDSAVRVFSLIGLNESGKTTILEAINYFVAADEELQRIYSIESASVKKSDFVPKSRKGNFNGEVTISADLLIEPSDTEALAKALFNDGYALDVDSAPKHITVTQFFLYKNSNFVSSGRRWTYAYKASKLKSSKSMIVGPAHPCWATYHTTLLDRIPQICYFPTFLFELPERIYLTQVDDEKPVHTYYRRLIQDILDSLNDNLTIKEHIVDRINSASDGWSWFSFLQTDAREQVNHVLLRASAQITKIIMQSWKRVFNRSFDNKRIELEYGYDESKDAIFLRMFLIDGAGAEKYDIGDRSLGFRWFFCFWLFTYFRTLRVGANGVVFLLDEPASNLHARAQEELLANMESLAGSKNIVIYSTHSHYLINPRWLNGAYIVSNGALNYSGIEDEFLSTGETDITATIYRKFVGANAEQRTYFLPVLDALDYKPSELTLDRAALLVEGKADYAFLMAAWAGKVLPFSVMPGNGAKSLGPLIGLLTGWGIEHIILLDDDKEGREAKAAYLTGWGMSDECVKTLKSFNSGLSNKSLESVLLKELDPELKKHFDTSKLEKFHAQQFLQQKAAEGKPVKFGSTLDALATDVLAWAQKSLSSG
jgi:energy-coupling factor transporter ATP-binding protein EcfA2